MSVPQAIVAQVGALAVGATVLLAVGALLVHRAREPLHRQRLGELSLLAALLWVPLALVPLPRLGTAAWLGGATDVAAPSDERSHAVLAGEGLPASGRPPARAEDRPGTQVPEVVPSGVAPVATVAERVVSGAPASATGVPSAADPTNASRSQRDDPVGAPGLGGTATALLADAGVGDAGSGDARAADAGAATLVRALAGIWLLGSVLAAGWLLVGLLRLARTLASARQAPEWIASLAPPGPLADTADRVRLLQVPDGSPFCVGLGRAVIVLPAALVRGDRGVLRHVLLHELAHARHGDGRGRLLTALALVVFWWHPLLWWLRRRIHLASEHVADARAAAVSGRRAYMRDLVQLAEDDLIPRGAPVGLPTVLDAPSDFYRRMTMLLTHEGDVQTRCSMPRRLAQGTGALALLAVMSGLLGATPARAQDSDALLQQLRNENEVLRVQLSSVQDALAQTRAMLAELSARADEGKRLPPAHQARDPSGQPLPGARVDAGFSSAQSGFEASDTPERSLSTDGVLDLAMRAVDLGEALAIARTALSGDQRRYEEGSLRRQELEIAELHVQSLQRKLDALHILIDAEKRVIHLALETEMHTRVDVDEAQITRLRARLDVLQSVARSDPEGEPRADAPRGDSLR